MGFLQNINWTFLLNHLVFSKNLDELCKSQSAYNTISNSADDTPSHC